VQRKDHVVILMLRFGSITGTLFSNPRAGQLAQTATSCPSRVSTDAQNPAFIDSGEV
jgi:hypothetical protein